MKYVKRAAGDARQFLQETVALLEGSILNPATRIRDLECTLNLSPEAAMLSGACGSVIIKYVNSSYFWVCTSLSKLKVSDAILAYGGATLVGPIASFATVWAMWAAGWI